MSSQGERSIKPNGCMYPFHPFQIMSYIVFIYYGYCFYFIIIVAWSKSPILAWSFGVPYTILFIAIAVIAIVATLSDPTDPTVKIEKLKKLNKYFIV